MKKTESRIKNQEARNKNKFKAHDAVGIAVL